MKTCFKCGENKPIVEFHKNKGMKDGRLNKCRTCVFDAVKKWRVKNPEARAIEYRKKKAKDPVLYNAKHAAAQSKRRKTIKNAQPSWASQQYIEDLYVNAAEANAIFKSVGVKPDFEIDHIVPLQHSKVCGLHVEHNLQILRAKENRTKSNTFKIKD